MKREPTNASIACISEGRILLVRRAATDPLYPGLWEFPGGGIQPGETPEQAAVREFVEECGSRVSLHGLAGEFSWESLGQTRTEVVFVGRRIDSVRLGPEHSAYAWASADDVETDRYSVSAEVKRIALRVLCAAKSP